MNRRTFLISSGTLLLGSTLPGWKRACAETPGGILLAPSMQMAADDRSTIFNWAELGSGTVHEIAMPLQTGHSWFPLGPSRHLGVVPEEGGRSFCVLDLLSGKVQARIETTSADLMFGGHGESSADGKRFYLSQFSAESGEGSISIRDGSSFAEVGRWPSYGLFPHEIYLRENGRELLVANLGFDRARNPSADSVAFVRVDVATGKMIAKEFVSENRGELANSANIIPEALLGEASYFLQVSRRTVERERKRAFILHPHDRAISVWELPKAPADPAKALELLSFGSVQPIGFVPIADRQEMAVALSDNSVVYYDSKTAKRVEGVRPLKQLRSSTHLYAAASPK